MFIRNVQFLFMLLLIYSTLGKFKRINNFLDDLIFEEEESKANDDADAINLLPGFKFELNFKHYSGMFYFYFTNIQMYFRVFESVGNTFSSLLVCYFARRYS
jgi:hypothetical protein